MTGHPQITYVARDYPGAPELGVCGARGGGGLVLAPCGPNWRCPGSAGVLRLLVLPASILAAGSLGTSALSSYPARPWTPILRLRSRLSPGAIDLSRAESQPARAIYEQQAPLAARLARLQSPACTRCERRLVYSSTPSNLGFSVDTRLLPAPVLSARVFAASGTCMTLLLQVCACVPALLDPARRADPGWASGCACCLGDPLRAWLRSASVTGRPLSVARSRSRADSTYVLLPDFW